MVTQWIVDALTTVLHGFLLLFPSFTLPSWLTTLPASASTVGGYVGQFSVWIPLDAALGGLVLIASALAVSFGVKVLRIVASFLTAGGGSAA